MALRRKASNADFRIDGRLERGLQWPGTAALAGRYEKLDPVLALELFGQASRTQLPDLVLALEVPIGAAVGNLSASPKQCTSAQL